MQQFYQQPQHQGYTSAPPGAPTDFYLPVNNQSQSYYQQPEVYSSNTSQTYVPEQQQQTPGLPNGAKIVAEYFLGYLDEQRDNSYTSPQPKPIQQEMGECAPQMQYYQPQQQQQQQHMQYPVYAYYPQQTQYTAPACPPGCEPAPDTNIIKNMSESDKEEVDIEIWEKPHKKKVRINFKFSFFN